MKLALVFDDLIQFGGAERLLLAVTEIWPDAPVYTSVISPKWKKLLAERHIKYKTSFMQHLPWAIKLNRFYSGLLFHVFAFESFNLNNFDVVLSISARYAHMVITKPRTCHICYMNSPGRMFWNSHEYFEHDRQGIIQKLLKFPLLFVRMIDYAAAQRVDYFIANSTNVQNKITKYYSNTSLVLNPFVENLPIETKIAISDGNYFLILSRLVPWKRIDIAIRACNQLKKHLVIVGTGSDMTRLKNLSSSYITFRGYISDTEKFKLIANCTAVLNTQDEDFGIAPLEAMSYGKPVIAYAKGGVLETVIPGKTGEFFTDQSVESLSAVLKSFDAQKYFEIDCRMRALNFDKSIFQRKLKDIVEKLCF